MTKKDLKVKYERVINELVTEREEYLQDICSILNKHNIEYTGNLTKTINHAIKNINDEKDSILLLRIYSWIKSQQSEINLIKEIIEQL